jgi:hypothetical protein
MPRAERFDPTGYRLRLWRAVEAQHVVSTMRLVDTQAEQRVLEQLLEASKPAVPAAARGLHYLLFTPFRYPPAAHGSRFRRASDPGVWYGADEVRTACAELGYWRWRFLRDSPALDRIGPAAQTVFRVAVQGDGVDLREGSHARRKGRWTDPDDYGATQALAARARQAGIALIRYESVRDPRRGGAAAVLHPAAFSSPVPLVIETWYLDVTAARVRWWRDRRLDDEAGFEFDGAGWA